MADDLVIRHFFTGFIRLHILYHAAQTAIYGAEIAEELVRHGYRLSEGTLYPTLHQLEEFGYLNSQHKVVQGKRRRYYRATAAGKKILAEAHAKLLELVAELVQHDDQPFKTLHRKRHTHPSTFRRKHHGTRS